MLKARFLFLILLAVALLISAGVVLAAGGQTTVDRFVIGGGGAHVEAGGYVLVGTVAEPVAGNLDNAAGASYHVSSGFWAGGAVAGGGGGVYLPIVLND